MIEITLKKPEDFLKVKETLTRMGIANNKDKVLYQSCHILQKKDYTISFILKKCFVWMVAKLK